MSTDSAQRTLEPGPSHGLIDRATMRARRFLCGLRGHDSLLHFQGGRISLMCVYCGHETPGWDVGTTPSRREPTTLAQSPVRLPLADERRAA
jgi:hypothetical protein